MAEEKIIGQRFGLNVGRKMLGFEASDDKKFIIVEFEEWMVAPNGEKINIARKRYSVKDYPDVIVDGIVVTQGTSRFSNWDQQLGSVIRSAIDDTLSTLELIPIDDQLLYSI